MDELQITSEAGIDIEEVVSSTVFREWFQSVDRRRFHIRSVHIQSLDKFGSRIGFIKLKADVVDNEGKSLPGIVFMRGGSVAILPVLLCNEKRYAILTVQPRLATGRFDFVEIPAGMLDGSGHFSGVAAREIEEELGLKITSEDLIDLSGKAGHEHGVYLSPGASEETIRIFAFVKTVAEEELNSINGRCTGAVDESEQITLRVEPLEELLRLNDAKSLIAYALFSRFFGA